MKNTNYISLASALHGNENIFFSKLEECLEKATANLSDEEFSLAFIPEKFINADLCKLAA